MTSLLALSALACTDDGGTSGGIVGPSREEDEATLARMYQEIFDLVADLSCSETASCASAPVGAKPCGGPMLFVVYSRPNVDQGVLQAKLEALLEFEQAVNIRHGRVSDCSVVPVPLPDCVKSVCVDARLPS